MKSCGGTVFYLIIPSQMCRVNKMLICILNRLSCRLVTRNSFKSWTRRWPTLLDAAAIGWSAGQGVRSVA
jgi:hypothetical protein